jgi:hypothetical protein
MKDCTVVMLNKESRVETVKDNREGYTHCEYKGANQARHVLEMVGYPFPKDFNNMVHSNMIHPPRTSKEFPRKLQVPVSTHCAVYYHEAVPRGRVEAIVTLKKQTDNGVHEPTWSPI